jgi:predicted TIM-barrel fold metal-dependent hydrolase
MPGLQFFDANITLGRPSAPKYRVVDDASVMKEELSEFGITGGLVKHAFAMEACPKIGNEMLSKALTKAPGYGPVWALMPHWTGEFPKPEDMAREMAAKKVRATVIYPTTQGFPLRPSVAGPLLDTLEEMRMPLFLPAAEVTMGAVEDIMRAHPSLPVVVLEVGQGIARETYALFKEFPNLHFELSVFMLHRGIEDVCERFGAERMIFGTRYPLYGPGCAISAVMYAQIPDKAKELIAAGNMKRLLGEVKCQ